MIDEKMTFNATIVGELVVHWIVFMTIILVVLKIKKYNITFRQIAINFFLGFIPFVGIFYFFHLLKVLEKKAVL